MPTIDFAKPALAALLKRADLGLTTTTNVGILGVWSSSGNILRPTDQRAVIVSVTMAQLSRDVVGFVLEGVWALDWGS